MDRSGLINQSTLKYNDGCYLAPWGKWQNSLTASVLTPGNVKYYKDNHGYDNPNHNTCKNLVALFESVGIDTDPPINATTDPRLHFANINQTVMPVYLVITFNS